MIYHPLELDLKYSIFENIVRELETSIPVMQDVYEIQPLINWGRSEPINLIYGISFLRQSDDNSFWLINPIAAAQADLW